MSHFLHSMNADLSKPTCRVCLQNKQDETMNSIFDLDAETGELHIYEKIEECAGIRVLREKKLPEFICADCYSLLNASFKFRTICRNSSIYLEEFVVDKKESYDQNPLSPAKNTCEKGENQSKYKTRLRERPSPLPRSIKNEEFSPPCSPAESEQCIDENFEADDSDEVWCDISYHEDDDISCGENLEIEEELDEKKPVKRSKKTAVKEKKAGVKAPKASSNGSAKTRIRKSPVKKEKKKKEKQPHICDVCGNIFPVRYALDVHMKRHSDVKPHKCEICGYAFYSNSELIRHMRTHTGSRPYKCSYCPRTFGDQSTLIKHERLHRNERPFKCETCGKSFTYSNVLKYHILVHTGEKPYRCEICGKCFNSPHHLRSHLRTLQHQNDPRTPELIKNIRKNNEDETLKSSFIST